MYMKWICLFFFFNTYFVINHKSFMIIAIASKIWYSFIHLSNLLWFWCKRYEKPWYSLKLHWKLSSNYQLVSHAPKHSSLFSFFLSFSFFSFFVASWINQGNENRNLTNCDLSEFDNANIFLSFANTPVLAYKPVNRIRNADNDGQASFTCNIFMAAYVKHISRYEFHW